MRSEKLKNEIRKLDVTDKLLLVEEVWNEIASSNEELPLPEWQKKELSKRLDAYDQGEIVPTAWQQVHEDLKNSYKWS
jgi:putative addiction module component (TIGR02574 family)